MIRILYVLVVCLILTPLQAKPVEIVLWHSLAGQLGTEVKKLAAGFNNSQTDFVIKTVYKGDYLESLTSFVAAYRAKQPPSIIQVFEVGTATMLAPKGIIKPVDELMREQGMSLPEASFFPVLRDRYSEQGHLMAMPFNTSIPVMFYNADALIKLGYTADSFPRTWDEFEVLAAKLRQAGFSCAYTSAYPGWILIESFSAIHGHAMFESTTGKPIYNNQYVINHLERLLRWQKVHYFEYGGRTDDATTLFTSGRCPLFSQSSGAYNALVKLVPFRVGIAVQPLDKQVSIKRFNNVSGGAALWAVAGQSPASYQGIARFFSYLAQPDVQQTWYQNTGYLPLGAKGVFESMVFINKHPSVVLAQTELSGKNNDTPATLLGMQNQIRQINDEALEVIFAGIKSPQQAMDDAVNRANHAMLRFRKNTNF